MKDGYCEDCGCKVFNGHCVNCHEETYIAQQYVEMGEEVPDSIYKKELVSDNFNQPIMRWLKNKDEDTKDNLYSSSKK